MEVVVEDTAVHTTKKKKHTQYKQYVSLIIVWIITIVASTFEIVIGLRNNSLTLLSDGFHNFSDVLALMIAFWALWVCLNENFYSSLYFRYQPNQKLIQ